MGVPGSNELGGGRDHQGIRPLQLCHSRRDRVLDARVTQPFPDNDIGNDLRIRGGVKDGPLFLQLVPQFPCVGQIPIVA